MILYSTGCPNCKRLKEILDKRNQIYEVVSDKEVLREKGIYNLPTLDIDGKLYSYKEAYDMFNGRELYNG